jgi:hypothetical protein
MSDRAETRSARSTAPLTQGLASAICLPAAAATIMAAIGQWDAPLFALALMLAPSLYLIERRA